MANSITCDQCGTTVTFENRFGRNSTTGEEAAWLRIQAGGLTLDACTRSCAAELIGDEGPLRPVIDDHLEVITGIANVTGNDGDDEVESRG